MIDEISKERIKTLLPKAQVWATAHLNAIADSGLLPKGWRVRIASANRTWEEQDALFAKGRGAGGSIVTNARGGQSNHNFGIAWDLAIIDENGKYVTDNAQYNKIASVGKKMGLEWGGDWRSFKDSPHYQIKVGLTLSEMRDLMRRGKPIPVPDYGQGKTPVSSAGQHPPVQVLENGQKTNVRAFLANGVTMIAVRDFVERFGGEILNATHETFKVMLNDQVRDIPGAILADVGYARFVDLNALTEWGYAYSARVLDLDTNDGS